MKVNQSELNFLSANTQCRHFLFNSIAFLWSLLIWWADGRTDGRTGGRAGVRASSALYDDIYIWRNSLTKWTISTSLKFQGFSSIWNRTEARPVISTEKSPFQICGFLLFIVSVCLPFVWLWCAKKKWFKFGLVGFGSLEKLKVKTNKLVCTRHEENSWKLRKQQKRNNNATMQSF